MVKRIQTFYRMIKGGSGHPFPGLYAVEKLRFKDNVVVSSEIVHEWDDRIISEAYLSKVGGQDAFDNFVEESEIDPPEIQCVITETAPRTSADLADLSKSKLKKELKALGVKVTK